MSSTDQKAAHDPRLRRQVKKQSSHLLAGSCLPAQLISSSFGRFHECLRELQAETDALEFTLPRVVVVGGRSAGKSSLLEAITKCAIFPRHSGFCTKMPIKLQLKQVSQVKDCFVSISFAGMRHKLQSKDDILAEVDKIMQGIEGITSQEVIVEIRQVNVPTFELVDLPGIQTFPEEQCKLTTDLTSEYLKDKDTLVLCAVDATIPAFDSSQAIELVRAAGKLSKTIIALTKSDLVTTEVCIINQIFERVLGHSDRQHLEELAGCVAVANRDHRDHVSLVDSDAAERQVFDSMLEDPAPAYKPEHVQRQLRQNMTKHQLILQLDALFHSHIIQHWKPQALACLQKHLTDTKVKISNLGPPVSELDKAMVMDILLEQVKAEDICRSLCKFKPFQASKGRSSWWQPSKVPLVSADRWGTQCWAENTIYLRQVLTTNVTSALGGSACLKAARKAFDAAFSADVAPLRLKRFLTLQKHVCDTILPAQVAKSMLAARASVNQALQEGLMQLYGEPDLTSVPTCLQVMEKRVLGSLISHLLEALSHADLSNSAAFKLPAEFSLEESSEAQAQRAALNDTLSKLQTAHSRINKIEEALNVSPPTASSSVSASRAAAAPAAALSLASESVHFSTNGHHQAAVSSTLDTVQHFDQHGTAQEASRPVPAAHASSGSSSLTLMTGAALPISSGAIAEMQAESEAMPASPAVSVAESFVHVDSLRP